MPTPKLPEPYSSYALNDETHWSWHNTFAGQFMQHNFRVYVLLDEVFKLNPQIKGIVEIGTGHGALTTYLALWGLKRNIRVTTVDFKPLADQELLKKLDVEFICNDVNKAEVVEQIERRVLSHPVLFICDGPAKQDEFAYWHTRLRPGSIICAHDYTVEFNHGAALQRLPAHGTVKPIPFLQERWNEFNAQLAIYRIETAR